MTDKEHKQAVAPEGWENTVKDMKKNPEIDNPWALAWSMKNKGDVPGGKEAAEFHALIVQAKEFGSDEARAEYLRKHPKADPKNHTVKGKDPNAKHDPYGKEWAEKREKKVKNDSDAENKRIQKEREYADKKPEIDRKRSEKLERAKERRNKQLDKKEEAARKNKTAADPASEFQKALLKHASDSAASEFQTAVTGTRVAARFAKTFPSSDALNKYLQKHPNADARDHKVVRPQDKSDDDKSMDDLKSRAKRNKQIEKKDNVSKSKKVNEDVNRSLSDLESRVRHNKKTQKVK